MTWCVDFEGSRRLGRDPTATQSGFRQRGRGISTGSSIRFCLSCFRHVEASPSPGLRPALGIRASGGNSVSFVSLGQTEVTSGRAG